MFSEANTTPQGSHPKESHDQKDSINCKTKAMIPQESKCIIVDVLPQYSHEYIGNYCDRFFNRDDQAGVEVKGRTSTFITRISSFGSLESLVRAHLLGAKADPVKGELWSNKKKTYYPYTGCPRVGTYLPGLDGKTKFGVIDIDGKGHSYPVADPLGASILIYKEVAKSGVIPYLEKSKSGNGFHVWVFFDQPINSLVVREFLFSTVPNDIPLGPNKNNVRYANPRSNQGVEVFPKTNELKSGSFGNFVWLPQWHEAKGGCNQFYRLLEGRK